MVDKVPHVCIQLNYDKLNIISDMAADVTLSPHN